MEFLLQWFLPLLILTILLVKQGMDWLLVAPVLSKKKKNKSTEFPPISVIVCGRNEDENILDFLPHVLEQDYPNFEVVFVNDRSVDESHLVLRALKNKYAHLKTSTIEHSELHWAGKKFALSMGLKSASNDLVLLTDADCYPSSKQWLREMTKGFSPRKKIILGYGAYKRETGLINKLIRSEALAIAIQYMGMSRWGVPYMGVGRNLAYDRNLFFDNRGFASHQFIASGDDDLFVNEVATSKNVDFCFNADGYTISLPERSMRNWIEQKRRHITTSIRYSLLTSSILLLIIGIRYTYYVLTFGILLHPSYWVFGCISLAINYLTIILQFYRPAKLTSSLDLLIWLPVSELFLLLFYPLLFIWNTLSSGNPWKNY